MTMHTYYYDLVGGDNRNGGTSPTVMASGTDGAYDGTTNFYSPSGVFTPAMVGHVIAIMESSWCTYFLIVGYVDAYNITLDSANSVASSKSFRIGGCWKYGGTDQYGASPSSAYFTTYWTGHARFKASPAPTSLGTATWSSTAPEVTFTNPVCAPVDELWAWTLAANGASVSTYTSPEPRIKSTQTYARLTFPTTPLANTKYAYKTLAAPLDLSAWSRLSCQFLRNSTASANYGDILICLCSDTLGDTVVASVRIPGTQSAAKDVELYGYDYWIPVVMDSGGALPAVVNSVAIYTGTLPPTGSFSFCLGDLIAVKAAGDPLEFSHRTLLGKVHNKYWQASTAYALNDRRKPTPPNRNGLRFKVTTAGIAGATEPVWPTDIGTTVVDGTVVWTAEGPEDTWFPVRYMVNSTTARIWSMYYDSPGTRGYFMEADTCETLGRLPLRLPGATNAYNANPNNATPGPLCTMGDGYTESLVSGGWSGSNMDVCDGETWFEGCIANQTSIAMTPPWASNQVVSNFGFVSNYDNFRPGGVGTIKNVHFIKGNYGWEFPQFSGPDGLAEGVQFWGMNYATYLGATPVYSYCANQTRVVYANNVNDTYIFGRHNKDVWMLNNGPVKFPLYTKGHDIVLDGYRVISAANNGWIFDRWAGRLILRNISWNFPWTGTGQTYSRGFSGVQSPVVISNFNGNPAFDGLWWSCNYTGDMSGIRPETGINRHTLSGTGWRLDLNGQKLYKHNPAVIPFKIGVLGNTGVNFSIWVKRHHPALRTELVLVGGTVPGYPDDVVVQSPANETTVLSWEQLALPTITPSATCVALLELRAYYVEWETFTGTYGVYDYYAYIDDLAVGVV